MRCPTLSELPPPPPHRVGFPWTEETPQQVESISYAQLSPKISIVTPSYNQGKFIEETIRSVLLQGYPNLEYIIVDGGSTDNTIDVIKKYESYLKYWVSEPDRGQSHALNKGIDHVTGDVFTFVNSDDLLVPNALQRVSNHFCDPAFSWVFSGGLLQVDECGKLLREITDLPSISWEELVMAKRYQPQSGTFWRTQAFDVVGRFREDLHYFFDQEFFIRLLMHYQLKTAEGIFTQVRFHSEAKSYQSNLSCSKEKHDVLLEFLPKVQTDWSSKFLSYRLIRLSYIIDMVAATKEMNLMKKLFLLVRTPISWTSPTSIKRVLLSDNRPIPLEGLDAPR